MKDKQTEVYLYDEFLSHLKKGMYKTIRSIDDLEKPSFFPKQLKILLRNILSLYEKP